MFITGVIVVRLRTIYFYFKRHTPIYKDIYYIYICIVRQYVYLRWFESEYMGKLYCRSVRIRFLPGRSCDEGKIVIR